MNRVFLVDEREFQKLLTEGRIVLVHFSHFAVMGHSVEFPEDLKHAIASYESEVRSCCALWPDHCMDLPGSVGIIFHPRFEHVVSVCCDDSGSSNVSGSEVSGGHLPSKEAILDSLNVPVGEYNEWRIFGASPVGVFVADPGNILAKKKIKLERCDTDELIAAVCLSLYDVAEAFPGMPIYTMSRDGLVVLCASQP